MRVPPFYRYTRSMSGLGLFVSGMVVGAAVYMSIHHQMFTVLSVENQKLKREIVKMQEEQKLADKNRYRSSTISKITVKVETDTERPSLDELTLNEIGSKIDANLGDLRGKSALVIKEAPLVFHHLIEEPVYKTSTDKRYKVQVKLLLFLQSELNVTVTAREQTMP